MNSTLVRTKPYIPQSDHEEILSSINEILNNGQFIQGKYVEQLEKEFAKYVGVKHAIATNSGGTALEIALRATGIENKKFIVPTQTFVASVSAIIRSNNIPIIVDIDSTHQCLDANEILKHVDKNTVGIMWVHMAGMITPSYYNIKEICRKHNLLLIEDAAHAVGASIDDIKAGNLGDIGCFSLFATKIITSGEGGMITTNNDEIAEKCRILRNHGCVRNPTPIKGLDYGVECTVASSNYRMSEMAAVVGLSQVKHIDEFVQKRNKIAKKYNELLSNISGITTPEIYDHITHSYWQYIILLNKEYDREKVCQILLEKYNIPTANAYWPACHKQPAFIQYIKQNQQFHVADDVLERHIALPMYVEMETEQVEYVCNCLKEIL